MKVLVTYISQTGNTQKVAQSIYNGLAGNKELKELSQVQNLDGYDLTFIGFPIVRFGAPPQAVTFLNQQTKNRKIAIFMTHSAEEGMPEVAEWTGNCTKAATGAEVKGVFSCQGELAQSVADFMLISGNAALVNWAKMRPLTIGQPDAARLEKARLWARRIVSGRVQIPPPH